MSGNTLIFIRHGKTEIDKARSISKWVLAEQGKKEAESLISIKEFQDVALLFSSEEEKSYATIKPLADKIGKKTIKVKDLGEIRRPDAHLISSEQYEERKHNLLANLNYTEHGWEKAKNALKRFRKAVEKINKQNEGKKIIICAHGTVLTLYFSYLRNELKNIKETLGFGSYAIVKNNKIIKDFEVKN